MDYEIFTSLKEDVQKKLIKMYNSLSSLDRMMVRSNAKELSKLYGNDDITTIIKNNNMIQSPSLIPRAIILHPIYNLKDLMAFEIQCDEYISNSKIELNMLDKLNKVIAVEKVNMFTLMDSVNLSNKSPIYFNRVSGVKTNILERVHTFMINNLKHDMSTHEITKFILALKAYDEILNVSTSRLIEHLVLLNEDSRTRIELIYEDITKNNTTFIDNIDKLQLDLSDDEQSSFDKFESNLTINDGLSIAISDNHDLVKEDVVELVSKINVLLEHVNSSFDLTVNDILFIKYHSIFETVIYIYDCDRYNLIGEYCNDKYLLFKEAENSATITGININTKLESSVADTIQITNDGIYKLSYNL